MGTREKQAQLKVYYDQKKKKVMFAEAQEDFVDILLSFFVLPLGTITKLSRKHVDLNDIKVGSLTSLYESVVNLNENHFSDNQFYGFYHKDLLVNQRNWLPSNWPEPKESLDKKMPQKEGIHIPLFGASPLFGTSPLFVKNKSNFIITEDLNVLPVKLDTSIVLLKSLGIENINLLEERTMSFGFEEFLNLLIWSLLTNNPLTNLVFGGSKQSTSCINNSNLNHIAFISSNSGQSQTVKLVIQKSKKKLLCAQVEKFFVELLFSFLTIPLGAFLHLTKDNLSPLGITNLYNSTSCLGDGEYLKSKNVKNKLLCPKVNVASYPCVTNLLPIYPSDSRPGSFLKEPATFIVYDNLEVNASSIDIISKLNTLGVSVGDMEVVDVSIGEKEALLLLKSSLTSTSALTDFLNTLC